MDISNYVQESWTMIFSGFSLKVDTSFNVRMERWEPGIYPNRRKSPGLYQAISETSQSTVSFTEDSISLVHQNLNTNERANHTIHQMFAQLPLEYLPPTAHLTMITLGTLAVVQGEVSQLAKTYLWPKGITMDTLPGTAKDCMTGISFMRDQVQFSWLVYPYSENANDDLQIRLRGDSDNVSTDADVIQSALDDHQRCLHDLLSLMEQWEMPTDADRQ